MDPAYAVYTAGGTRIGRRILASLSGGDRMSMAIPKPALSNRRARRTPFFNSRSRRATPPYVPSGFPQREGGRA